MASKQPSRKGKKAWRKNVDVSDVHEGLEQLRDEIIQGYLPNFPFFGPANLFPPHHRGVIKEKPDEQLFALDTSGDNSIAKTHFKTAKVLKVDEILAARSAIPAVSSRKRPGSNITDGVISKKTRRANGVSYKDLERLRGIAYGQEQASGKLTSTKNIVIDYDPWAEETPVKELEQTELHEKKFSFIPQPQPIKEPKTLKQPPISLAESGRPVPAVRVPEAGISYNPEFTQWDQLLQTEGQKELEREQKRLAEQAEERRIKELAAQPDPESDDEDYETETDTDTEKPTKKMPERKTQVQRNKIKRQKEFERMRLQEQRQKKQALEFALVKKYARDAEAKERLRLAKRAARLTIDDDEKNPKIMRKKKFGKSR